MRPKEKVPALTDTNSQQNNLAIKGYRQWQSRANECGHGLPNDLIATYTRGAACRRCGRTIEWWCVSELLHRRHSYERAVLKYRDLDWEHYEKWCHFIDLSIAISKETGLSRDKSLSLTTRLLSRIDQQEREGSTCLALRINL